MSSLSIFYMISLAVCCPASIIVAPSHINGSVEYYIASSYNTTLNQSTTIYCSPGTECNIECDETESCIGMVINASTANKLTLICSNNKACNYANITGAILQTNIYCNQQCYGTNIYVPSRDSNLSFTCTLCKVSVIANYLMAATIGCNGRSACARSTFQLDYTQVVNVMCKDEDACIYAEIWARHTDNVSINCDGYNACDTSIIDVSGSQNVILDGDISGGSRDTAIYLQNINTSLSLNCGDLKSCSYLDLVFWNEYSSLNQTHISLDINCVGKGSCYDLNVYTNYETKDDIHFSCDASWNKSCGKVRWQCWDQKNVTCNVLKSDCIKDWTKYTKVFYQAPSTWSCSSGYCCPFIDGFIDEIYPTPAPTRRPTTVSMNDEDGFDYDQLWKTVAVIGFIILGCCCIAAICVCIGNLCGSSGGSYSGGGGGGGSSRSGGGTIAIVAVFSKK